MKHRLNSKRNRLNINPGTSGLPAGVGVSGGRHFIQRPSGETVVRNPHNPNRNTNRNAGPRSSGSGSRNTSNTTRRDNLNISPGTNGLPRGVGVSQGRTTYTRPPSPAPPARTMPGPRPNWLEQAQAAAAARWPSQSDSGRTAPPPPTSNWHPNRDHSNRPVFPTMPNMSWMESVFAPVQPTLPDIPKVQEYDDGPGTLTDEQQAWLNDQLMAAKEDAARAKADGELNTNRVKSAHDRSRKEARREAHKVRDEFLGQLGGQGLAFSPRFAGGGMAALGQIQADTLSEMRRTKTDRLADITRSVERAKDAAIRREAELSRTESMWRSTERANRLRAIGL